MGETASDQDTFVSIENLICSPQPNVFHENADGDGHSLSDTNQSRHEDTPIHDNPRHLSKDMENSARPRPAASPESLDDHSTFMWNLYAPETGDVTAGTEDCEHTIDIPGDSEQTPDPSDICGEFHTASLTKSTLSVRRQPPFTAEKPTPLRLRHSQEPTEDVLHNATNGVVSYEIENPFLSRDAHASAPGNVVLYTSMGSFSEDERHFWESLSLEPNSPSTSILRRFFETIKFQQKQVQDLKAAEIEIASATLRSERRRHSEVEHERSAAIETLMEQLSEECEQRSSLEEENANLRVALTELQELREKEADVEKVKSSLRVSRAEQNRVNDAILSMNVELEDSKRRGVALRKQRDSAERRFKDLMQSATSDRERFFKFQTEMSANFAIAVNEVEDRKNEICRLLKERDDREKAFQLQTTTVKHLQEQLQFITEAAVKRTTRVEEEEGSVEKDPSLAATVISSLQDEVLQANNLLKERGEELECLRQQIYSKDELLSSVQGECAKLRTAASVRRLTSRISHGSCVSTEHQQSTFLRRLSEKLHSNAADDGEVFQKLTERIDILSHEKRKFESMKEGLIGEVKQRETALHAVRAEMGAEIATLKADLRHQETLRVRAQDDCKVFENKYREFFDARRGSYRESIGDITSSSYGPREWSLAEESEAGSRRESSFSTLHGEDGVRWNDPIIVDAIRCLNVLIGRKDELSARNRDLREKLDGLLRNIGMSNEDGEKIRSLLLQSKDFQDELTKIVGMQQDVLGSIAGSGNHEVQEQSTAVDDTLPYLRHELSPQAKNQSARKQSFLTTSSSEGLVDGTHSKETNEITDSTRGEAAQFLRQQLNETRALCNEKLKANVELCGVINELKHEVQHLASSKSDIETALHALKETHDGFVSRLALLIGAEQSAVAIEDSMRTVMHRVAELGHQHETHKERESVLFKRVTCLIGQKHVLTHIIDLYQSKYKLDITAVGPEKESPRQVFRKCVRSIVAIRKMSHFASAEANSPSSSYIDLGHYELPIMGAIGRRRTRTTSPRSALVAIEAMPRLERAVVEKTAEVFSLKESLKALERSLAAMTVPTTRTAHDLPTSFVYKEDIMNRKNDMARRLRGVIKEKEELDERLSKEKQARIAAEARSSRYVDKVSILKKKLQKTVSTAESKERTYKTAIIYLKGKAEKANDDGGWLDENVAPWSPANRPGNWMDVQDPKRKIPNEESRAILEHELESAESELARLIAGSEEHERKSQYIKGLYGGIQRLGQTQLADCGNQLAP